MHFWFDVSRYIGWWFLTEVLQRYTLLIISVYPCELNANIAMLHSVQPLIGLMVRVISYFSDLI